MISLISQRSASVDSGIVWPASGTSTPDTIGDPFGHRTFTGHSSGMDFHRGTDHFDSSAGSIAKSPLHGRITRREYTHFPFNYDHSGELTEHDPSTKATFTIDTGNSRLRIVGKNNGTTSLADMAKYGGVRKFSHYAQGGSAGDWMMDLQLQAALSSPSGRLVFGIYDSLNNEYVYTAYNGSTFTAYGRQTAGLMTADGTTNATSGRTFFRIKFTPGTGEIKWQFSTDNSGTESGGWTDIATQGTIAFTHKGCGFLPFIGWESAAAGSDDTVDVEFWGYWDAMSGIGRFGNWVLVGNGTVSWVLMHMDHLICSRGQEVRPGDSIGNTGTTGFDITSGRILSAHVHLEYLASSTNTYDNNTPTNPLAPSLLPRSSTTIDIGVVRDSAFDPPTGLVDCHRLTITVTRGANQNFNINSFSLTGNTTSRTLNWDTRAGLDPSDHDAVSYDGVYFQPVAFDENSSTYVFKIYFAKTTVGGTFVSAFVKDTSGTTVWSE